MELYSIIHQFATIFNNFKDIIGECNGCCKLGQAAWFIATNTEANFDYLQGEKMGCAESYDLLKAVVKEAENIVQTLYYFSDMYRKGMPMPVFWPAPIR